MCGGGGGGWRGRVGKGGTHYIKWAVTTKGVLFSESLERGGGRGAGSFHYKIIREGNQIYLSGKGFMSVWKGDGKLP